MAAERDLRARWLTGARRVRVEVWHACSTGRREAWPCREGTRRPRCADALPLARPRADDARALRQGPGQPARRRGHLLRVPVVLPDPGAGVLGRRLHQRRLPGRARLPGHRDRAAVPGDRHRRTATAGTISLKDIESAKAAAGIIGFLVLLYAGLGWVSGLRVALEDAFEVPRSGSAELPRRQGDRPRDARADRRRDDPLGRHQRRRHRPRRLRSSTRSVSDDSGSATPLLWALGVPARARRSTLLFCVMFRLLGQPGAPASPLWQGALLGAIAFELLKWLVVNVIGTVGGSAFAPLAIAVTLVVWINYFSRLVIYGAVVGDDLGDVADEALGRAGPVASEAGRGRGRPGPLNARIARRRARAGDGRSVRPRQCSGRRRSAGVAVAAFVLRPTGRSERRGRRRPTPPDIEAAVVLGSARRRPRVRRCSTLGLRDHGVDARSVVLKLELSSTPARSRLRGALNSVLSLPAHATGVCAASGGNHAAAVAVGRRRAGLSRRRLRARATPRPRSRRGSRVRRAASTRSRDTCKDALEACTIYADDDGRAVAAPVRHVRDRLRARARSGSSRGPGARRRPGRRLAAVAAASTPGSRPPSKDRRAVQPVEPEACPDLAEAIEAGRPVAGRRRGSGGRLAGCAAHRRHRVRRRGEGAASSRCWSTRTGSWPRGGGCGSRCGCSPSPARAPRWRRC